MGARAISNGPLNPARFRAAGLFALLFVAAQLLFAAHADSLYPHAPQSCEYCLAAAVSDDPNDLVTEIAGPVETVEPVRALAPEREIVARAPLVANSRAPPLC